MSEILIRKTTAVKTLWSDTLNDLEHKINEFILNEGFVLVWKHKVVLKKVIDIKYSDADNKNYSAMIIFEGVVK